MRNWHAHVVIAPITLEREHSRYGIETGRFSFESQSRLPPMPKLLRALGGNGPNGRRGAGQVVKQWRKSLCEIQNAELSAVGATKRYDPRSYRDLGIERTPGQHRGTKRAAMEDSGRAATHWSADCPEWTQVLHELDAELDRIEATDHERNGVYEAIEEVRLEMGAHAPESEPPIRDWGLRVRAAIREEREGEAPDAEGWRPAVHELVDAIRTTGRACTVVTKPAPWQVAWRAAKRSLADPLRLGAVADGIAQFYPGDVDAMAADPRPETRAVAARARRYRVTRDRWVREFDEATRSGRQGLARFAQRVVSAGVPLEVVLGGEAAATLKGHIETALSRREARAELADVASAMEHSDADAMAQAEAGVDWHAMDEKLGRRNAQRKRRELATHIAVTALREAWTLACETGPDAARAVAQGMVHHEQWPAESESAKRRAWNALGAAERALIESAANEPERAIGLQAKVAAKVRTVMNSIEVDPKTRDRIAAQYWDLSEIEDYAPAAWTRIQKRLKAHEKSRGAMQRALAEIGIEPDEDPGRAARKCAETDAEQVVELCLEHGEFIENDHDLVWRKWWPTLRTWAREREQSYARGNAVEAQAEIEEIRLLETIGRRMPAALRLALTLRKARDAERLRRADAERRVAAGLKQLAETGSNVEAARARKDLAALLARPGVRAALGEERARAVARQAGIRDRAESPAKTTAGAQRDGRTKGLAQ